MGTLASTSARAESVTLTAARDTTLYEDNPSWSNGAGAYLFTGKNSKVAPRRALLAFDLVAAVPPGSHVESVTLSLVTSRTHAAATSNVSVHRVTARWDQSTSNAPANEGGGVQAAEGDATWTHRAFPSARWATEGGDFEQAASAQTSLDNTGPVELSGPALVADVQRWLEGPAENFGWILLAEDPGASSAKRFGSREGARDQRPRLSVTFTPPAARTGACCTRDSSCGYVLDPGASCTGDYQGLATTCTASTCPPPLAACCRSDVSAACSVQTEAACGAAQGRWMEEMRTCEAQLCPVVLTPFVDALPLPAVATPSASTSGAKQYRMAIVETRQKLHRDLPATTVWGFDDGVTGPGYPGPTIEVRSGEPASVTWVNDLRDASGTLRTTHFLPVDTCLHGATNNAPRSVIHLHGGHVASAFDGQPELTLLPGEQTTYEYPNKQRAATLWYHDHALGITRLNVIMGIAGFYLVRDAEEDALALPSGRYEVPLVIQDRSFHPDGRFKYPEAHQEHFFGDTILVNGKVWPYFEVDRGQYRLRILNGSTSRTYTLSFSPSITFLQIGSDGGLLRSGVAKSEITIAPGERADIVVNFASDAASEILLRNSAPAPFPHGDDMYAIADVMKFVVKTTPGQTAKLPVFLSKLDPADESEATLTRDFVLERASEGCGGGMWMINKLGWGDITEKPRLGTSEVWRFINRSGLMHPMHLHLTFFRVLDRQPILIDGERSVPTGAPQSRNSGETGWKDTVEVGPFEIVRVLAKFEDFAGRFPYHCHILEHEDHGMMRQFETLPACDGGDACEADAGKTVLFDGGHQHSDTLDASVEPDIHDGGPSPQAPASVVQRQDGGCSALGSRSAGHAAFLVSAAVVGLVVRRRKLARRAPKADTQHR